MPRLARMVSNDPDQAFDLSSEDLELLMQTHQHESVDELEENFGGIAGLEKRLKTNLLSGLTGDVQDLAVRRRVFGHNEIPQKSSKSFFRLMFEAMQDVTLITLIICAILSFALTFYPSDTPSFEYHPKHSKSP